MCTLDIPLTPTVTDILSRDTNITLKWSHDTKCFKDSTFQYIVGWESIVRHKLEVHTDSKDITIQTIPRQTYTMELRAVGSNGSNEQHSKDVFLWAIAGMYH